MKIIQNVESINCQVPFNEFTSRMIPKIMVDLAFQANKDSRWSEDQKSEYITSLICGMAPSQIVLADVDSCLKYAIEQESHADIEYFTYWKNQSASYLNLDGNNRVINKLAFINGEFGCEPLIYNVDDKNYTVQKGKNDFFSTLPKSLVNKLQNSQISLVIYTKATREQLSEIFIRINDGKPLNDAEKRNSKTSKIASTIRLFASEYADIFNKNGKWFSQTDMNRRGLDDFIAGMALAHYSGLESNATAKNLMSMYDIDSDADRTVHSFKRSFEHFVNTYMKNNMIHVIPHRNLIFDLYIITDKLRNDNMKIKDEKSLKRFLNDFIGVCGKLLASKKTYDLTNKNNSVLKDFTTICGGRQVTNNIFRNEMITQKIDFSKYFIEIDSKRGVTTTEKFLAAFRDDFTTPEGKKIVPDKLFNGKEYHGGHVVPHADGGKSVIENIAIQEARDNLKLGRKKIVKKQRVITT